MHSIATLTTKDKDPEFVQGSDHSPEPGHTLLGRIMENRLTRRLLHSGGPALLMIGLYYLSREISMFGVVGYSVGFAVGMLALLAIPGWVIVARLLHIDWNRFFWIIPVAGLGFQILVVLAVYVPTTLWNSGLALPIIFPAVSASSLSIIGWVSFQNRASGNGFHLWDWVRENRSIIMILFIGLAARTLMLPYSTTPAPDGALYLSQARNSVLEGTFSARVSGDSLVIPEWTSLGLSTHPFVVFALSVFFLIGDPSYGTGKLMALFSSLMLGAVCYYIARELFGAFAGLVAALLLALHPWFLFWSAVLYGPEILATLWLSTFLFILTYAKSNQMLTRRLALSLGVTAVLVLGSQYVLFWGIFLALPVLLAIQGRASLKHKTFLLTFSLVLVSIPFAYFASRPDFYILTEVPWAYWVASLGIPIALLVASQLRAHTWPGPLISVFAAMNVGFQVLLARAYLIKQFYSDSQLVSVPVSGILEPNQFYFRALFTNFDLNRVLATQLAFWELLAAGAGLVVVALALGSFLIRVSSECRTAFVGVAIAGSLFYTVGSTDTETVVVWSNYRFVLGFVPIIALLAASLIEPLARVMQTSLPRISRSRGLLPALLIALIVASYAPSYVEARQSIDIFDTASLWGPLVEWAQSTPPETIFLIPQPYLFNWLTQRSSFALHPAQDSPHQNLDSVISLIRQYRIDYLVILSNDAGSQQLIASYLSDPSHLPDGFDLAFQEVVGGISVWAYNVSLASVAQ